MEWVRWSSNAVRLELRHALAAGAWFWFRRRARGVETIVYVLRFGDGTWYADGCHGWAVDAVKALQGWVAGPIPAPVESIT